MGDESDRSGYVVAPRYWVWLGSRRAVSILLWLVTLAVAAHILTHSWNWFGNRSDAPPERHRADGNAGHCQIDFGGQWVMGRMLLEGHGRELYHRQRQWDVVRKGFPAADEAPIIDLERHIPRSERKLARPDEDLYRDADRLMGWLMGSDPKEWRMVGGAAAAPLAQGPLANPFAAIALARQSEEAITPAIVDAVAKPAIGGPLYPPVHAFFYAPLAFLRPLAAYHLFQVIAFVMVFAAGLGVAVLTRGRIPWSVATLVLLLYSGNRGGLDLAQNPALTLNIAIWGWVLASRGYNTAGGVIWGLFAFKPVWALALCIVPLLTRRWRFCAAMIATGIGLCAATLPFVGVQTWLDWLEVGKEAASLYNVNQNWITLSRDLQSVPRRILHDFNRPEAERDTVLARALAWTLWCAVFATTVIIYLRYADHRRATGIGMAFLFFGAWLTCYHFMYYDALVSAVGCAVLFAEPRRFLRTRVFTLSPSADASPSISRALDSPQPIATGLGARLVGYVSSFPLTVLFLLLLVENSLSGMALEGTIGFGYYAHVTTGPNGATSRVVPHLVVDTTVSYPWETFLILALWAWCAWRLVRGEERMDKAPSLSDAK